MQVDNIGHNQIFTIWLPEQDLLMKYPKILRRKVITDRVVRAKSCVDRATLSIPNPSKSRILWSGLILHLSNLANQIALSKFCETNLLHLHLDLIKRNKWIAPIYELGWQKWRRISITNVGIDLDMTPLQLVVLLLFFISQAKFIKIYSV